jgi:hypothetical protein
MTSFKLFTVGIQSSYGVRMKELGASSLLTFSEGRCSCSEPSGCWSWYETTAVKPHALQRSCAGAAP